MACYILNLAAVCATFRGGLTIYWHISASSPSPVRVQFHTTARLSCGPIPVYDDVMWVKCNPGSSTPALAIRRNRVLIHNYRHGGARVLPNGSLKLEYVRRWDTGEYRCYGMSGSSQGLRMARLHVNGKLSAVVYIRIISTYVCQNCKSYNLHWKNLSCVKQNSLPPRIILLCSAKNLCMSDVQNKNIHELS